jgi:hypothetical protein
MAFHGLVVGCDAYPDAGADLSGAVRDALLVRAWLVGQAQRDGGPEPLALLSPSATGAQPPKTVDDGPAKVNAFVRALDEMEARSLGPDDIAVVYFAGHGCRSDPDNAALGQDALLFTELDEANPGPASISVSSLVTRLAASRFGTFILLTDACRDYPYPRRFQVGTVGYDPDVPRGRPYTPHQYVFHATVPGETAKGSKVDGAMQGRFTSALVKGLSGDGAAKVFDDTVSPAVYEVRWSTLTDYVRAAVPEQDPRPIGETRLVLARFADGSFVDVPLHVEVAPERAATDPSLAVTLMWSVSGSGPTQSPLTPVPGQRTVPPRRIQVSASSSGLKGYRAVDVYDAMSVTLDLDGPSPTPHPTGGGLVYRGGLASAAALEVVGSGSTHPATFVELVDTSGATEASGLARLSWEGVPGAYQLRASVPGAPTVTTPVALVEGRTTMVAMDTVDEPAQTGEPPAIPWVVPRGTFGLRPWAGPYDAMFLGVHLEEATGLIVVSDVGYPEVEGAEVEFVEHGRRVVRASWVAAEGVTRVAIRVADHRLTVPLLRGASTAVDIDDEGIRIALSDAGLGSFPNAIDAHLAAAQAFAAERRFAAARAAVARFDAVEHETSVVAAALRTASWWGSGVDDGDRPELSTALAESVPLELQPFQVTSTMWAVLLDAPAELGW